MTTAVIDVGYLCGIIEKIATAAIDIGDMIEKIQKEHEPANLHLITSILIDNVTNNPNLVEALINEATNPKSKFFNPKFFDVNFYGLVFPYWMYFEPNIEYSARIAYFCIEKCQHIIADLEQTPGNEERISRIRRCIVNTIISILRNTIWRAPLDMAKMVKSLGPLNDLQSHAFLYSSDVLGHDYFHMELALACGIQFKRINHGRNLALFTSVMKGVSDVNYSSPEPIKIDDIIKEIMATNPTFHWTILVPENENHDFLYNHLRMELVEDLSEVDMIMSLLLVGKE